MNSMIKYLNLKPKFTNRVKIKVDLAANKPLSIKAMFSA